MTHMFPRQMGNSLKLTGCGVNQGCLVFWKMFVSMHWTCLISSETVLLKLHQLFFRLCVFSFHDDSDFEPFNPNLNGIGLFVGGR